MADFFISYTAADKDWAEWVAWVLDESGATTTLQAWDFGAGSNFALEMHRAAGEAQRTIAVLSPDYLKSKFGAAEWAAAFIDDPTGQNLEIDFQFVCANVLQEESSARSSMKILSALTKPRRANASNGCWTISPANEASLNEPRDFRDSQSHFRVERKLFRPRHNLLPQRLAWARYRRNPRLASLAFIAAPSSRFLTSTWSPRPAR